MFLKRREAPPQSYDVGQSGLEWCIAPSTYRYRCGKTLTLLQIRSPKFDPSSGVVSCSRSPYENCDEFSAFRNILSHFSGVIARNAAFLVLQRVSGEDFVAQLRGTLEGLIGTDRERAGYRELVK